MSVPRANSTTKILIVEDEASIAIDLKDILEEAGYTVCAIAYTFDQALDLLSSEKPQLALLDIALKGRKSGLDVAKVISTKYQIPFIFLTSFSNSSIVKEAVDLSPSSYLVKPFKEKDILPAILLALSQQKETSPKGLPSFEYINTKIANGLSPQEFKVMTLLCQGHTNKEMATVLFVSPNTIKTHLYKLYQKLNTNTRSATISKVMSL